MSSGLVDFGGAALAPVSLDVRWNYGARSRSRSTDPKIQVHAGDPHTFILRQSKAVSYEAPFLYLFCGNDRALLLDTGATREPAKSTSRSRLATNAGKSGAYRRPGYTVSPVTRNPLHGS